MQDIRVMQNTGVIFDWKRFRFDVRRDVRNCALFLFFFYAVNIAVMLVIEAVALLNSPALREMMSDPAHMMDMLSGSDQQGLVDAVTDAQSGAMLGLMSICGIAAGGCVFLINRKKRFFTDLALPAAEPLTPRIFVILIFATQGIQLVYGLIVDLIDRLLPEGLSLTEGYEAAMEGLSSPLGLAYIVLVGPLFEELIFRGAVMGPLRRFGDNFAILFSSILFGFYHMVILQIPFAFVLGLLLGYVAARWSLRASVALHVIVNGLSVLMSNLDSEAASTVGGFFMIGCGIVTLILLIRWREAFRARVRAGAVYYPHTWANGFSSIAFWVFLIVMTAAGFAQMYGFGMT